MPPAKKVAQKPVQTESEQTVDKVEVAKKAVKVVDPTPEEVDDPISMIAAKDVMVYMSRGVSYYAPEAEFTKENPFVLMDAIDAARLINSAPDRFIYATKEQVQTFYSLG